MKLLIFLGNPGSQYEKNRHNIGFLIGEEIMKIWNCEQRTVNKSAKALITSTTYNGEKLLLTKPQTYMNLSGQTVSFLCNFYKCTNHDIIVIHDDIDLIKGAVKYKFGGSAGGQNGVKSIIASMGTDQFARVRVGIDRPTHPSLSVSDYVLGNLSQEELDTMPRLTEEVLDKLSQHFFDK